MAFVSSVYRGMYARFMGPLAQPVIFLQNNGTGFDAFPDVPAHVSAYKESELVTDGTIQLGDLKLIIQHADLPPGITELTLKDRIVIDSRQYGVIHWDSNTRSIGPDPIAIEVTVRGGGTYVAP